MIRRWHRHHTGSEHINASGRSYLRQLSESRGKLVTQGIVGIIVEALHAPHGIEFFVSARLFSPSPAKSRAVLIANLYIREIVRKTVDAERGVCA